MEHLHNSFDYDHDEGRLRWKAFDDKFVIVKPNGSINTGASSMSRVKPCAIAGTLGFGDYKIKQYGQISCGCRMVWQHVTGEMIMGKIRTIRPRETKFSIDNLYLVPFGTLRVNPIRAKNSTVISFSYEKRQYTVVEVDQDYNKTILSYHGDIDSALEALNKPVVSFL